MVWGGFKGYRVISESCIYDYICISIDLVSRSHVSFLVMNGHVCQKQHTKGCRLGGSFNPIEKYESNVKMGWYSPNRGEQNIWNTFGTARFVDVSICIQLDESKSLPWKMDGTWFLHQHPEELDNFNRKQVQRVSGGNHGKGGPYDHSEVEQKHQGEWRCKSIPRAPITSIFEGQPPKTRPFPTKTTVIWVPGRPW